MTPSGFKLPSYMNTRLASKLFMAWDIFTFTLTVFESTAKAVSHFHLLANLPCPQSVVYTGLITQVHIWRCRQDDWNVNGL